MIRLRYNNQSTRLRSRLSLSDEVIRPQSRMAGHSGFSLVEVIVALGVFSILAAGIFNVVTGTYRNFYGTGDKQTIAEFAQEGIEATRSIRDNFWQDIEDVVGTGDQSIVKSSEGYWEFNSGSDTLGALTRTVAVTAVERDADDEIVASGGTVDPNTKKVTVTISGSGIDDYVLTTYLTNWGYKTWEQSDWSGVGDREFWSDLTMASSSFSNISTSTLGELALSQLATPGVILGDWTSFATTTDYYVGAWRPYYGYVESPDGDTMYSFGNTNVDIKAFDVSHIREGIFELIWENSMSDQVYSMTVHPNGNYLYAVNGDLDNAETSTVNWISVIDTTDGSVISGVLCDDYMVGDDLKGMDVTLNSDSSMLYAISSYGGFYTYEVSADGSTLTPTVLGGGGEASKIVPVWQEWGYNPHRMYLDDSGATDYMYVVSDYSTYALTKWDISSDINPSLEYNWVGSGDCNDIEYLGNSGSGNTFAIMCDDAASELKTFRDNGSSFTALDTADPGTFNNTSELLYDGDNTVIMINKTTASLNIAAYDVSDPEILAVEIAEDTSTYTANYSTWPNHYLEYFDKKGGFFLQDYVGAGLNSSINFTARPETRNTGSGYDYKRTIELGLTDKVVDGSHGNFPVLIGETQDYLKTETNGGKVKHDYGYDIIFTSDSAGTDILNYEIEKYSSSTGEFIAWVEIPTLASNTDIFMFYGNSNIVTTQERKLATWNSAYKFVSHMNQRHELVDEQEDSTAFRNNLVEYNDATQSSDGKIGYAYSYDGDGDYNYSAHSDDFGFVDEFTWSTWVRVDGLSAGTVNGLMGVTGSRFYASEVDPAYLKVQVWDSGSTVHTHGPTNDVFNWGEWTKIDITFNRPTITLYRNGSSLDTYTADYDLLNDTTGTLITGSIQSNAYWLNGHLDEVRLSNVARSAGWIETNYNNQNATSTFYSIGSEAQAGGYNTPGTLYSSILDIGSTDKELRSITVEQDVPSGCSLQITAEVSNDITFSVANITSEVYDDNSTSYYTSSTSATLNGKRYLRYKVDATACNSNTETPTLYGAKFNYR